MNIPDTIKIGGITYDVGFEKNLIRDERAVGTSTGNSLKIKIDESIPLQNKESTFIHEVVEQINYVYNMELEHHKICLLETALYQIINDNPKVFEEAKK